MPFSGTLSSLQYRVLKRFKPSSSICSGSSYENRSKLEVLFGPSIFEEARGKAVIDYGCGNGREAVELAERGASRVIGLDIQEQGLIDGRAWAQARGVADRCIFTRTTIEKADIIISIDAFEHYSDPAAVLADMGERLNSGGCVWTSFGPTWLHPFGGHFVSIFPWSHLLFTEEALMRWRNDFKNDGAKRFSEVEGGANKMTIRRFERLIERSGFRFERFEPRPIGIARPFHNRLTREYLTSAVNCKLVLKPTGAAVKARQATAASS
jgi:SAM-dependent methyltransferase